MSVYDKLGGEPAVEAAVELFYGKVLADDLLKPLFAHVAVDGLKNMQKKFLTKAFGGPDTYDGRSLRDAHRGKGITDEHFAKVAGHLSSTLKELGVADADHDSAMAIAASTKPDIVEDKSANLKSQAAAEISAAVADGKLATAVAAVSEKRGKKKDLSAEQLANVEGHFKAIDTDGSGFIEAKELRVAMEALGQKLTDEDLSAILQGLDKNGDDKISLEEYTAMVMSAMP